MVTIPPNKRMICPKSAAPVTSARSVRTPLSLALSPLLNCSSHHLISLPISTAGCGTLFHNHLGSPKMASRIIAKKRRAAVLIKHPQYVTSPSGVASQGAASACCRERYATRFGIGRDGPAILLRPLYHTT